MSANAAVVASTSIREHWSASSTWEATAADERWLAVLERGLGHRCCLLEARHADAVVGHLPLALVSSRLFGRFLVSLPYLSIAGVRAETNEAARQLIDRAVELADRHDVRYLELRHEQPVEHPALTESMTHKVQMRLELPETSDELWKQIGSKVRNQVRSAEKHDLSVDWGRESLVADFYDVFSRNMRDLGTPVYSRKLFEAILRHLPDQAELCVVRRERQTIAAALLVHGPDGKTEVPSASSLREFNATNSNMLMYWNLLQRTLQRGQRVFDFGRSSVDSNTYRFKKQWGAKPTQVTWQYYVRRGSIADMRPENSRHRRMIELWKRLPLGLTRVVGPMIVRGIP